MYNIGVVEIFQSLKGIRELRGAQQMTGEYGIAAYQLQVITSVIADILNDVTFGHPFGDYREPPSLKSVRNTEDTEDVGMGQVLPHGDFCTEALYGG